MGGDQPQHVLTCWSPPMGLMPLPTMPGKIKKNPLAYFAFYSRFLKIYVHLPSSRPVLIGGTFVPHNYTVAEYVMRFAGMALMRGITKGLSKSLKGINHMLQGMFGASNKFSRALCHNGFEPVNFVTGEMSFEWEDFALTGSTTLKHGHSWQSQSSFPSMFGKGVFSNLDLSLLVAEDKSFAIWKHPDELIPVHIPYIEVGEAPYYFREQKIFIERTAEKTWAILYQQTKFTYTHFKDASHYSSFRIVEIEHADGTNHKFEYHQTTENVVASVTDQGGRQLLFDLHSDKKHVGKVFYQYQDEYDQLLEYNYDDNGNLTHVYDRNNKAIQFVYDKKDRVVERTNRNGQVYWWKYDEQGRVIETSGIDGFQHGQLVYHPKEGYNEIIYPQTTGKIEKIFYNESGLIDYEVDALGGETWYEYNKYSERKMIATPEGRTTGFDYDEWGNIKILHRPDGESITYKYNEVGQLLQRINAGGNVESWQYDELQRLAVYSNVINTTVTYFYHGEDRLPYKAVDSNRFEINWQYNSFGQLVHTEDGEGATKDWEYDNYGRLVKEKNLQGTSMHWKRDEMGRVRAIYETGQQPLKITYDAYDLPVQANDGREEWLMEYTPMGSLRRQVRQSLTNKNEKGELIFGYDEYENLLAIRNEKNEMYRFIRDENNNVVEEIGFDGQRKKFRRDADGFVTRAIQHDGKEVFYDYDLGGRLVYTHYKDGFWESFEYDKTGLLAEAANPMATVKFNRNALGQIIQEQQELGHTVNYIYNAQGQMQAMKSSLGADMQYNYDALGYLNQLHAGSKNGNGWQMQLQQKKQGLQQERQFTGGVKSAMEYDHTGLPISQIITAGNTTQADIQYNWKDGMRLASTLNSITGNRVKYDYDSFGSLAAATYNRKDTVYKNPDEVGNLYETSDRTDRKYGRGSKLLKDKNWYYHYDELGNTILKTAFADRETDSWQKGDWGYTWFANGMLATVKKPDGSNVNFEYDALGRRTAKVFDNSITRFVWNGNVLLHEWKYALTERPKLVVVADGTMQYDKAEPTENITTWHYELNSFTPCGKETDGKFYSIISDYLGTPTHAFDEAGKKVWERQIDCYGRIRIGNNKFVPFLYPGQYVDEETGLAYNRFRYYSPETGNYLSQDPIGLSGGIELYGYVSDTTRIIDPSGLTPTLIPSFGDLKGMAQNTLDFSTAKDGAVFWSGPNMKTAQSWATLNGKTTLEQTVGGRYLASLELFDNIPGHEAAQIWDIASKRFADAASGEAHVFSTGAKRFGDYGERTWWRIEKPALLKNSKVKGINRLKRDGNSVKRGRTVVYH